MTDNADISYNRMPDRVVRCSDLMNKFKCGKCRKTLFFYPDNIDLSNDEFDIYFELKCPNTECGYINKIAMKKMTIDEFKEKWNKNLID